MHASEHLACTNFFFLDQFLMIRDSILFIWFLNSRNGKQVLQDLLDQNKDGDIIDFQLQDLKDMVADFTSSNEGSQISWR